MSMGVHCPSYPTVRWERWDCSWESTVLSEPHYVLFLSHSTPKYTVYYGSSFVSKVLVKKCVACISRIDSAVHKIGLVNPPPNSIVVKIDLTCATLNSIVRKIDSVKKNPLNAKLYRHGLCHVSLGMLTFDSFLHYLLVLSHLSWSFNN